MQWCLFGLFTWLPKTPRFLIAEFGSSGFSSLPLLPQHLQNWVSLLGLDYGGWREEACDLSMQDPAEERGAPVPWLLAMEVGSGRILTLVFWDDPAQACQLLRRKISSVQTKVLLQAPSPYWLSLWLHSENFSGWSQPQGNGGLSNTSQNQVSQLCSL